MEPDPDNAALLRLNVEPWPGASVREAALTGSGETEPRTFYANAMTRRARTSGSLTPVRGRRS